MLEQGTTAVNDAGATQDASTAASAPVETNSPEVAAPDDFELALNGDDAPAKAETEADTTESEPTGDEQQDADETNPEEQPRGKAEDRKQQLNTEIRDLVTQRNTLRQQVEQLNSQVYQPATEQELIDQGYDPAMAAIEAMKQEREVERYNNQIAEAQLQIESESNRVLQDFPIFNPASKEYNQAVATNAAQLLQSNLVIDRNTGQIIGSHVSPYTLYQTIAAAAQASAQQGQIQGQKATERMLANADVPTSTPPAKKASDPFLEGFNAED